jgi:hypothetical protein
MEPEGTEDPESVSRLARFHEEASLYCAGINDSIAREFALAYVAMIEQRARGLHAELPRVRHSLFEPTRTWICTALDRMKDRYFNPASFG